MNAIEEFLTEEIWLVWSIRKNAWWKPEAKGYTKNRFEAARVDLKTAVQWACSGWKSHEKNIPEDAIVPDCISDDTKSADVSN